MSLCVLRCWFASCPSSVRSARRRAIDRAFDALEQLPGLWISQRAAALEVLLSHAGPDRNAKMLNTVRALAGSINDITQRVTLLVAMAPYLETAERDRLLMEALEETRPIRDGAQRADVIITLANTLDAAGREQALRDAFVAAETDIRQSEGQLPGDSRRSPGRSGVGGGSNAFDPRDPGCKLA